MESAGALPDASRREDAPAPPAPSSTSPNAMPRSPGQSTTTAAGDRGRPSPVASSAALPCVGGFGGTRTRSNGLTRNRKSSSVVWTTRVAKQKWNSSKTTGTNSCKPVSTLRSRNNWLETLLNSVESTSGCSPNRSAPPCWVRSANMRSTSNISAAFRSPSDSSSIPSYSTRNWPTSSNSTSSSQYRMRKLRVEKVHCSSMMCAGIKWWWSGFFLPLLGFPSEACCREEKNRYGVAKNRCPPSSLYKRVFKWYKP
mmetsp:Transcript_53043/g.148891  ORF Transcript_53043/g.148891 Transcript_53043/m.148891 type:complete len:255 (+) Transcript_53043:1667-2431(+)